jgi:hypothetical protein
MSKQQSPAKDAAYIFAVVLIIFIIARAIGMFSNIQWP